MTLPPAVPAPRIASDSSTIRAVVSLSSTISDESWLIAAPIRQLGRARDVGARVEDVERRQGIDIDIALAEDGVDRPRVGLGVTHLDEHEARGVALEVQAREHLRLVALDVERQQVDLGRAHLVEDRRQRPRRGAEVVRRLLLADRVRRRDPLVVAVACPDDDGHEPAEAQAHLGVGEALGHQRRADHARSPAARARRPARARAPARRAPRASRAGVRSA